MSIQCLSDILVNEKYEGKNRKKNFWFLKEEVELDLSKPEDLDFYLQHLLSHGGEKEIKELFKTIPLKEFKESFSRIKHFLPQDVRNLWESWLENS